MSTRTCGRVHNSSCQNRVSAEAFRNGVGCHLHPHGPQNSPQAGTAPTAAAGALASAAVPSQQPQFTNPLAAQIAGASRSELGAIRSHLQDARQGALTRLGAHLHGDRVDLFHGAVNVRHWAGYTDENGHRQDALIEMTNDVLIVGVGERDPYFYWDKRNGWTQAGQPSDGPDGGTLAGTVEGFVEKVRAHPDYQLARAANDAENRLEGAAASDLRGDYDEADSRRRDAAAVIEDYASRRP